MCSVSISVGRGPLSFLAGMPSGTVAGLIDLEGEAASHFGGGKGDDGVEGMSNSNKGSGLERIARLSEGAYNAVMLTPSWRCRVRLAAGNWLMAYWPVRTFCCFDLVSVVLGRAISLTKSLFGQTLPCAFRITLPPFVENEHVVCCASVMEY